MAKSNQSTSTRKQERQEKAERKKAAEKKRRQRAALKEDAVESERKKARIGMSKSREKNGVRQMDMLRIRNYGRNVTNFAVPPKKQQQQQRQ